MNALAEAINIFFHALQILLIARIILSWIAMGRDNRLMELLYMLTEPILAPIRGLVNRSPLGGPGMVIDFSVLIAFVLLRVLHTFIMNILF